LLVDHFIPFILTRLQTTSQKSTDSENKKNRILLVGLRLILNYFKKVNSKLILFRRSAEFFFSLLLGSTS